MPLSRAVGRWVVAIGLLFAAGLSIFAQARLPLPVALASSTACLVVWMTLFARAGWLVRSVLVGSDGLLLRGWAHRRFVPYDRVRRVSYSDRGVGLVLDDGAEVPLEVMSVMFRAAAEYGRRDALQERIRRELFALRRGGHLRAGAAVLARRGRPLDEWAASLRHLLGGPAGYREAPFEVEPIAEILEDAGAPVDLRIGAAIALSECREEAVRRRVRVAVEACLDEPVHAALDAAARDELDDDTLHLAAGATRARAR